MLAVLVASAPARADNKVSPLCDDPAMIDRIEVTLVCDSRDDHRTFSDGPSVRAKDGWHTTYGGDDLAFTAEETTHVDALLADGLRRLCARELDPNIRWTSFHTKQWGYELPRCRPSHRRLTLFKGRRSLSLDEPHVVEMMTLDFVAHLHERGHHATFKP